MLCSNELKSTDEPAPILSSETLFLIPAIKADSLVIFLCLQVLTKTTHFNKGQFSILFLCLSPSVSFYLSFLLNKLFIWKTFQEQLIMTTWKQFDWLIKGCFPFRNTWINLGLILLSKVRTFELEGRISTKPGFQEQCCYQMWMRTKLCRAEKQKHSTANEKTSAYLPSGFQIFNLNH